MSSRVSSRLAAALLLAVSGLSCESSTGPDEVAAEFVLVSLASQSLPASPGHGSDLMVMADTLRLFEDGTGQRRMWYTSGSLRVLMVSRDALTWRTVEDRLEVSFPCDDHALASCIAPPHLVGTIEPGLLWVVPNAIVYSGATAVYQRSGTR